MASENRKAVWLSKVYFLAILIITFILVPAVTFAQDKACSGDDPYETDCPLDNYVWLMAVIAIIVGAIFIYKHQKQRAKA